MRGANEEKEKGKGGGTKVGGSGEQQTSSSMRTKRGTS